MKIILEILIYCLVLQSNITVVVAQLVRASVCGTEGRGFEPHHPPKFESSLKRLLFLFHLFPKDIYFHYFVYINSELLWSSF